MTSALVKQLLSLSIACGKHSRFNVLFMCRCTIAYITLYVKYNVFHTSDIWMPLPLSLKVKRCVGRGPRPTHRFTFRDKD